LRDFFYPQNGGGYPHLNAVIHRLIHSLSTGVTVRNVMIPAQKRDRRQDGDPHKRSASAGAPLARARRARRGAAAPRVPAPARQRADAALGGPPGTRRPLARTRTVRRTSAGRSCDHRGCKSSDRRTPLRRSGTAPSCSSWLVQFRFRCDPGRLARQLEVNLALRGPEGREESRLPLTQQPVQVGAVHPGQLGSRSGACGQPRGRHWVIIPVWAAVRPRWRSARARPPRRGSPPTRCG